MSDDDHASQPHPSGEPHGIRLARQNDRQGRFFAEAIADSIRDGLLVLTPDLHVEAANAAFYRTFRVEPKETEGRLVFDLGNGQWDIPRLRELLERILPEREAIEGFEVTHEFEELGPRVMHLKAQKLDLLDRILLIIEDFTERRRADDEIRELNARLTTVVAQRTEQLTRANRELDAFNYSVSHDLRAPLRGVDGFALALLEEYGERLDATGRHYLERVRAGAQRMGVLIDDLLRLSRISRSDMQVQEVDLEAVARQVVAGLRERDPERQVDVRTQQGMVVQGDEGLLRIALENLLSNSWKFTSDEEHARIEVGMEETEGEKGRELAVFVRDNGVGFDPAYEGKLFTPFGRLHSDERFPGSGIGLTMVQRIAHLHGGRVDAVGMPGEGATFRFALPAT